MAEGADAAEAEPRAPCLGWLVSGGRVVLGVPVVLARNESGSAFPFERRKGNIVHVVAPIARDHRPGQHLTSGRGERAQQRVVEAVARRDFERILERQNVAVHECGSHRHLPDAATRVVDTGPHGERRTRARHLRHAFERHLELAVCLDDQVLPAHQQTQRTLCASGLVGPTQRKEGEQHRAPRRSHEFAAREEASCFALHREKLRPDDGSGRVGDIHVHLAFGRGKARREKSCHAGRPALFDYRRAELGTHRARLAPPESGAGDILGATRDKQRQRLSRGRHPEGEARHARPVGRGFDGRRDVLDLETKRLVSQRHAVQIADARDHRDGIPRRILVTVGLEHGDIGRRRDAHLSRQGRMTTELVADIDLDIGTPSLRRRSDQALHLVLGERQGVRPIALDMPLHRGHDRSVAVLGARFDVDRAQRPRLGWMKGDLEIERTHGLAEQEATECVLDAELGPHEPAYLKPSARAFLPVGDPELVVARWSGTWDRQIQGGHTEFVGLGAGCRDRLTAFVAEQELDGRRGQGTVVLLQPPADSPNVHGVSGREHAAVGVHEQAIHGESGGALVRVEARRPAPARSVDDEDGRAEPKLRCVWVVTPDPFLPGHECPGRVGSSDAMSIDVHGSAGGRPAVERPRRHVQVARAPAKDLIWTVDRNQQVSAAPRAVRTASLRGSLAIEERWSMQRVGDLLLGDRNERRRIGFVAPPDLRRHRVRVRRRPALRRDRHRTSGTRSLRPERRPAAA
jgi:hypothetical protein